MDIVYEKQGVMDLKKGFFFVLVLLLALMYWAFSGTDNNVSTQATGSALPSNGMVGMTIDDAVKQAGTTVPTRQENTPADPSK